MKKDNNFICHKCELVNPEVILIEKWNKGEDSPYRIEILYLHELNGNYSYHVKAINLKKKSKIILTSHTCGMCHGPAKKVTDKGHQRIIKRNEKLWRK